jgi:predicted TIM-barrel fold metal-dependent hydrolase
MDTSYSFDALGAVYMKSLIKGHGVEKILFGTDSPWTDQMKEIENIRSLGLSSEETGMILGDNAMQLLTI